MILSSPMQMLNGEGGGLPDWLPTDATAFLDFANGNYWAGGASRDVADLLGGDFDPGELSGSGLYFDNSNANRPIAIGALFDDIEAGLAAGCTIVFEINHIAEPYGFLMCIMDAASRSLMTDYVNLGHAHMLEDQDDIWFDGEVDYSDTGIHRSAFTLARHDSSNYEFALSIYGDSAVTQTVAYAPFSPINTITIGHDGDDTFVLDDAFIRSITLYPAKLPAELPTLSA